MVRTHADCTEAPARCVRLPRPVVSPTLNRAALAQRAGMERAGVNGTEAPTGRIRLAAHVLAPALNRAVLAQSAGVPPARADCAKAVRGLVARPRDRDYAAGQPEIGSGVNRDVPGARLNSLPGSQRECELDPPALNQPRVDPPDRASPHLYGAGTQPTVDLRFSREIPRPRQHPPAAVRSLPPELRASVAQPARDDPPGLLVALGAVARQVERDGGGDDRGGQDGERSAAAGNLRHLRFPVGIDDRAGVCGGPPARRIRGWPMPKRERCSVLCVKR